MTERQLAEMVAMGLHLQKPNACVELGGHVNILVLEGHDTYESGIVGTDMRDVAPGSIAECRVAVAAVFFLDCGMLDRKVDLGSDAADGCNKEIETDRGQDEEVQHRLYADFPFGGGNGHGDFFLAERPALCPKCGGTIRETMSATPE